MFAQREGDNEAGRLLQEALRNAWHRHAEGAAAGMDPGTFGERFSEGETPAAPSQAACPQMLSSGPCDRGTQLRPCTAEVGSSNRKALGNPVRLRTPGAREVMAAWRMRFVP